MYSSSALTQSGFQTSGIKGFITSLNTQALAIADPITDAAVQQAIASHLKTGGTGSFADEAASTKHYKKLAFEMSLAKIRAGDQNSPNGVAAGSTRDNTTQVTKRTSGTGYWPKTTDIGANSYALLKEWFPIGVTVTSSKYSCEMGWIMHRMVSQRELANAVYIAQTFHADFYHTATALTTADKEAFFPAAKDTNANYYTLDVGLSRAEAVTFQDSGSVNMYSDAADLLKKQLGVAGVAIQRTTAFATTQFSVAFNAGSAAFTVYEQSLFKYYKYTDFLDRPVTKA